MPHSDNEQAGLDIIHGYFLVVATCIVVAVCTALFKSLSAIHGAYHVGLTIAVALWATALSFPALKLILETPLRWVKVVASILLAALGYLIPLFLTIRLETITSLSLFDVSSIAWMAPFMACYGVAKGEPLWRLKRPDSSPSS